MKRTIIAAILMLAWHCHAIAQEPERGNHQGETFELNRPLPNGEDNTYTANNHIKLLPGFRSKPDGHMSTLLNLGFDGYGIYPPDNGLVDGSGNVVGSLGGVVDIGAMGGLNYTIPIELPKGINGMEPNVTINYNNQGGNGLLGWGWDLGAVSCITRTGQTLYHDGQMTAADLTSKDRFLLDGQRLILVNGEYWQHESEYKTENDCMSKIVLYRVVVVGEADDRGIRTYFKVWDKSGNVLEYSDRLRSSDGSKDILWMLSSVTDRYGNSMEYHYMTNNDTGEIKLDNIEYTINESHHVEAQFRVKFNYSTNRGDYEQYYIGGCPLLHRDLLESIQVTQKSTGNQLYSYNFNYIRQLSGDDNRLYCILSSVDMRAYNEDGTSEKLNPTRISWDNTHPLYTEKRPVTNSGILEDFPFTGDFNGDGYTDVAMVPYKESGHDNYPESQEIKFYLNDRDCGFTPVPSMTIVADSTLDWVYTFDINGDGLDDLATLFYENDNGNKTTSIKLYKNNPVNHSFQYIATRTVPNEVQLLFGDYDGNKTTDIIVLEKTKEVEHVGSCSGCYDTIHYVENAFFVGYQESQLLNVRINRNSLKEALGPVYEAVPVDYDGDGIFEAFLVGNDEPSISNHNTKLVAFNLTNQDCCFTIIQSLSGINYLCGTNHPWCYAFPGDFNGDGKTDVLYNYAAGWGIAFSDGNIYRKYHFSGNSSDERLPDIGYYRNIFYPSLRLMDKIPSYKKLMFNVADLDGDGCTDICFTLEGNHSLYVASRVRNVTESTLEFRRKKRMDVYFAFRSQFTHVGNFLGRDNASLLESIYPTVDAKSGSAYIISPASVNKYNSVQFIADGMGNITRFTYDYLMPGNDNAVEQFYSFDFSVPDQNGIRTVPLPVMALKTCKTEGINGSSVIEKYSYSNAYGHRNGHGFMGFERTVEDTYRNSLESGWKTRKVCKNEHNTMGEYAMMLPAYERTYINENGSQKLVNSKTFVFDLVKCQITDNPQLVVCPAMTCKTESTYSLDDAHSLIKTVSTEYEYTYNRNSHIYNDSYACKKTRQTVMSNNNGTSNCEQVTEKCSGHSTYTGNWIINRPDCDTTILTRNGETKATCTVYNYANNNTYKASQVTFIPNNGNQPNDPLTTVTHYSYDAYGNNTGVTVEAPYGIQNEQPRETHYYYGTGYQHRLVTMETQGPVSNGYSTELEYDFHDRLNSATDWNGKVTLHETSPMGVVRKTFPIDGSEQRTLTLWAADSPYKPIGASYYTWSKKTGGVTTMVFYHKSGLELRSVTFDFNGTPVFVDKRYNANGLLEMESEPYREGEPEENLRWTSYTYDDKDRPLNILHPNGTTEGMEYHGLRTVTTTTPAEGNVQKATSIMNAMGWLKEHIDAVGTHHPTSVHYEYYPDGKLKWTKINDDETTTISLEYDHAGNRNLLHDPDYCTATADLTSIYNAFGEEVSTTTPNGFTTTYLYDQLGRLTQRTEEEPAPGGGTATKTTIWNYNENAQTHQKGLLQTITYPGQTISYQYDGCQRVQEETVTYGQNESYTTGFSYDLASRKESIQYPSGFTVYYKYNTVGHLKSIVDGNANELYSTQKTVPTGQTERFRLGERILCNREYYPDKQLIKSIKTTNGEIILQDLSFDYDGFSNLAWRKDNKRDLEERFTYDHLNRLTGIRLNGNQTGVMNYDPYGRMTDKTTDNTLVFSDAVYDETPKPHAIDQADVDASAFSGQAVTYTCFDKVKTVTQGNSTLAYTYGYDRQRILMQESVNNANRAKRYVGNCEFEYLPVDTPTPSRVLTYLTSPTGVFAVVERNNNGESIHYILKDNLGSWTTITDSVGAVEQEMSFDAWGNRRDPDSWRGSDQLPAPLFDRGFTGHEHLYAFGLINMNGRVYDPQMSSFLSVDAYVQSPDNSQNFNRYAYCLNNPLKYTDPSGWQLIGGMTPGNPFHENWGVNFAQKVVTAHEAREMLWDMGIPHGVWVEENEIHGGGGESHDGNGDDGKKKKEDKSKQAKDAVNYTNGVATLIGGAAKNAKLCSIVNKSCSALSIGGIIYNIYYDYTSFDKREISFYSFCARTNNSIGEYALTRIPYGIGVPVSVIVTAVDICGGFDNNIYNEEWVKSVLKRALDGIRDCFQPNNRQFYEESINVYYKHGM